MENILFSYILPSSNDLNTIVIVFNKYTETIIILTILHSLEFVFALSTGQ